MEMEAEGEASESTEICVCTCICMGGDRDMADEALGGGKPEQILGNTGPRRCSGG